MILEKNDDFSFDPGILPEELKPAAGEFMKLVQARHLYQAAIKEVSTKLEILDDEFKARNDYNPIHHMECRVKSVKSTMEKINRKGFDLCAESMSKITDIAGIRVICNYIDDIYKIAELLLKQSDIELVREKDYIEDPKKNGYRSLHLVVLVPVFLSDKVEKVPVELQIRTVVMDAWASLEHELKYKREETISKTAVKSLKQCAEEMAAVDARMQKIHREL